MYNKIKSRKSIWFWIVIMCLVFIPYFNSNINLSGLCVLVSGLVCLSYLFYKQENHELTEVTVIQGIIIACIIVVSAFALLLILLSLL